MRRLVALVLAAAGLVALALLPQLFEPRAEVGSSGVGAGTFPA